MRLVWLGRPERERRGFFGIPCALIILLHLLQIGDAVGLRGFLSVAILDVSLELGGKLAQDSNLQDI
jgi:hypothetical protein